MAYIHQINKFDIDNDFGNGPVVSVFFNYCPFHCVGCWNSVTWERNESLYMDDTQAANIIINALQTQLIDRHMKPNLSLLGGEPFSSQNIDSTIAIIKQVRHAIPDVTIGAWTGFSLEQWLLHPDTKYQKQMSIIDNRLVDVIIDGRFIQALQTKNQMFGSINQRVIDVAKLNHHNSTYGRDIKQILFNALASQYYNPATQMPLLSQPQTTYTTLDLMKDYINNQDINYNRYLISKLTDNIDI